MAGLRAYAFILGVPRSGTTLLARQVARHPQTCAIPKAVDTLDKLGGAGALRAARPLARLSAALPQLGRDWHQPSGGGPVLNRLAHLPSPDACRAFIEGICYPESRADRILVNKRIANLHMLDLLAWSFPHSYLICLHRDPVATVMSLANRRRKKGLSEDQRWGVVPQGMPAAVDDPIADCARQYARFEEQLDAGKALFPRSIDVDYETFCAQPAAVLDELEGFLGLGPGPRDGFGDIRPRTAEVAPATRRRILELLAESPLPRLQAYVSEHNSQESSQATEDSQEPAR